MFDFSGLNTTTTAAVTSLGSLCSVTPPAFGTAGMGPLFQQALTRKYSLLPELPLNNGHILKPVVLQDEMRQRSGSFDSAGSAATTAAAMGKTMLCKVCGDVASGKHFGTYSCGGCKGFFRRTIRQGYKYECRFTGNCQVEQGRRNFCRSCRFQKCLRAGMRTEYVKFGYNETPGETYSSKFDQSHVLAVQSERDPIGRINRRKPTARNTPTPPNGGLHVDVRGQSSSAPVSPVSRSEAQGFVGLPTDAASSLPQAVQCNPLAMDSNANNNAQSVHAKLSPSMLKHEAMEVSSVLNGFGYSEASFEDCAESMQSQILALIDSLKFVAAFRNLPMHDKVALIKAFSAEYLLFEITKRSLPLQDCLLLADGKRVISKSSKLTSDLNNIVHRLTNEVIDRVRRLEVDDMEFSCMKAIGFFNPDVCSEDSRAIVQAKREILVVTLESYVMSKLPRSPGRLGNLVLLLPALQSIGSELRECVKTRMENAVDGNISRIIKEVMSPQNEVVAITMHLLRILTGDVGSMLKLEHSPLSVIVANNGGVGIGSTGIGGSLLSASPPMLSPVDPDEIFFRQLSEHHAQLYREAQLAALSSIKTASMAANPNQNPGLIQSAPTTPIRSPTIL